MTYGLSALLRRHLVARGWHGEPPSTRSGRAPAVLAPAPRTPGVSYIGGIA